MNVCDCVVQAEEVEGKASALLPSGMLEKLADPKWKERLEACEQFKQVHLTSNLKLPKLTFTVTVCGGAFPQ